MFSQILVTIVFSTYILSFVLFMLKILGLVVGGMGMILKGVLHDLGSKAALALPEAVCPCVFFKGRSGSCWFKSLIY